jgi:hypothetical protein|tara:strand:+ start:535 stop:957 length:423 start_codon:yes stop_codon:yes gene_type:complete
MILENKQQELKMKDNTWNQHTMKIANEIGKAFEWAGVNVLKHEPYTQGWLGNNIYGAFITVNDKNGEETVLPITVNQSGAICYEGGEEGWSEFEVLGHLNMSHAEPRDFLTIKSYARTIDFIKYFAELDGFGQDFICKRS